MTGSIHQVIRGPKRILGSLALGLCAIGVAIGSGADFTAHSANPSNTFSAGSLSIDNTREGAAIFSPTNMKPGGFAQSGIVDIKNSGSVDGVFKLYRDELASTDAAPANPAPFASKVNVKIVDCGKFTAGSGPGPAAPACGDADDATLYDGSLEGENSALALGVYKPGDQHRFLFSGSLDSSTTNEYFGDSSSARYVFDAVQTP